MDTELLEFRIEEQLASTSKDLVPLSLSGKNNSTLHYGKFYFSGLKKGQGITVANALRRVLLYDIFGIGITKVKFTLPSESEARFPEGRSTGGPRSSLSFRETSDQLRSLGQSFPDSRSVIHEFSTVSGMKESILELLINLRTIIWKKPSKNFFSKNQETDSLSNSVETFRELTRDAKLIKAERGSDTPYPPPESTLFQGKWVLNNLPEQTSEGGIPLRSPPTEGLLPRSFAPFLNSKNTKSDSLLSGRWGSEARHSPSSSPEKPFFVLRAKHLLGAKKASQTNTSFSDGKNESEPLPIDFLPQIVNPEQYLATFLPVETFESPEGVRFSCFPNLEIDFQIQDGSLTVEKQTESVGTDFLVDAGPFFPIKKVNYTVEAQKNSTKNMLSEGTSVDLRSPSYECVFFEIWTDGSIHPQTALSEGFSILETLFQQK